ncbi:MAG: helix-turn-helix domain-containing protein [Lachnospiraceae bacterium]|nr:helix-turn-helix domain-containing protein [Lachnospiraceae bacterium]
MKNNIATNDISHGTTAFSAWNRVTFGLRLAILRQERGYSARKMSLELGQNKNYINSIEMGNNFPTMEGFFNICDYLRIDPQFFFDLSHQHTVHLSYFKEVYTSLSDTQIESLCSFIVSMKDNDNLPLSSFFTSGS